jgi:hypothetical protein
MCHNISDTMNQEPDTSEKMWKVVSLILLALLIISNGFQLYELTGQSAIIADMREGMQTIKSDLNTLRGLAPLLSGGCKRSDVLSLLRRSNPGASITDSDSTIGIGRMRFIFDGNGTLVRIDQL